MATAKKADLKVKSTNFTGDDGKLIYPRAHYDHLDGKPTSYPPTTHTHTIGEIEGLTIPSIPSVMNTNEGNIGSSTTQRTINAKNLKDIILHHSPAGERPSSWSLVSDKPSWIGSSRPTYTASAVGAAPASHQHSVATDIDSGFMSNFDKTKLDGIAAGAQKNSTITKGEIEAKLTGSITSHTHNYRPAGNVPWTEVSDKPTWIGTNKPSYNLSEITETTIYKNFTTLDKNKLDGIEAGAQVNVGTNLSQGARGTTTLRIDSSTGSNLTLPAVTTSLAGLMTSTDKTRLDVLHSILEEDTENNVVDSINEVLSIFNNYPEGADLVTALAGKAEKSHTHTISNVTGLQTALNGKAPSTHPHSVATIDAPGFMSSADKTKLDGIATVATSGSYNDLSNKPSIPSIPSVMGTSEGNIGSATTQRTINAANLKTIILNHSPAGSRPSSWDQVSDKPSWIGANKPTYTASEVGAAPATHPHSVATDIDSGFMSNFDKAKLDGIAPNATANSGTVTNVSSGTQVSGLTLSVANGTTTPTITTSISNAANFRSAIGAGTGSSNLTIGTTASTAKAGNYQPTWGQVTSKPTNIIRQVSFSGGTMVIEVI